MSITSPSRVFAVVVVLRVSVGRHDVTLARRYVCSFVLSLGGVVRMVMIFFS